MWLYSFAGVLTLYENLSAPEVSPETMSDAIQLAQFYLLEARRLAEAATITAEIEAAEKLRRWHQESWPVIAQKRGREIGTMVPKDVVQFGPGSLREKKTVKWLMVVLSEHGCLRALDEGAVIDDQSRKTAYRIAVTA